MAKDSAHLLSFRIILWALFRKLPKLSSIAKSLRELRELSSDAKMSVGFYLERNADAYPDSSAILFEDDRYTHREFNEWVNRYAHYLLSLGVQKGDVICAFLENRPEILFLLGAVSKIGAIVSLINPHQRGPSLIHSFTVTPSNHFIIGEERIEAFETIKHDLKLGKHTKQCFLKDRGAAPTPDGYIDWQKEALASKATNPPTTADISMEDAFAYLFTSGTTGLPKAAITQHGRWVTPLKTFGQAMLQLTSEDTIYIPLPFYHGTAMYVGWPTAASGGAAIAMRRKFSTSNFWKDVKKFNATAFVYIGELCRYLILEPELPEDSKNTIRKIVGNGLRPDIWKAFKSRFGISEVYEFYGASEGNIAFANFLNLECTVGFCPMPYAIITYDMDNDAAVKNDDGFLQRVEKGEAGLLIGQITEEVPFVGYTDVQETEKKILRNVFEVGDAWFDTGDLMRDIGFKHGQFVDRIGDTFRWKGENVSTTQVEAILNDLDHITESNVYGVSIPGTDGRAGMAAIIRDSKAAPMNLDTLIPTLSERLPAYALPVFLRVKEEFETTDTLKLKKATLRKEAFDPNHIPDPLYVRLPGTSTYIPLTKDLHADIIAQKYSF
jgi:citronellyl-CoA synthetase